jgi:predicted amidophosphoribosyltransferase
MCLKRNHVGKGTNKYLKYVKNSMVRHCKEACEQYQHIPKMIGYKYVDHNYCSMCVRWFLKIDFNRFCPCCGVPLRHKGKNVRAKMEVLV